LKSTFSVKYPLTTEYFKKYWAVNANQHFALSLLIIRAQNRMPAAK